MEKRNEDEVVQMSGQMRADSKMDASSPNKKSGVNEGPYASRTITHRRSMNYGTRSSKSSSDNHFGVKKRIEQFLESFNYMIFMTVVTIYALFGDDVRVLSTNKDGDAAFWVITAICMGLFLVEIVLASICKDGYILGFFFWLDLLSTVSMLLDIGWVNEAMFGSGGGAALSAVSLARAGRASRVGTRAGRIVRVVRLVRLSKLYKHAKQSLEKEAEKLLAEEMKDENLMDQNQQEQEQSNHQQQNNDNVSSQKSVDSSERHVRDQEEQPHIQKTQQQRTSIMLQNRQSSQLNTEIEHRFQRRQTRKIVLSGQIQSQTIIQKRKSIIQSGGKPLQRISDEGEVKETNIGKELTELTNKRVITIVMLILFSVPILNLSTYRDANVSFTTGLQAIQYWSKDTEIYNYLIKDFIVYHEPLRTGLVFFKINSTILHPSEQENQYEYEDYRTASLQYYTSTDSDDQTAVSISNTVADDELNAILSIVRTIFVSIVLSVAAVLFSKDVQDLILTPIEKMLETVKKISENPLVAAQEEENKAFIQMIENGEMKALEDKEDERLETVILQKLIVKIGTLLALGFGEAGSQIIAQNMGANASINPMLPGKKVMAIFGFCDIRNFTDATEVLQQDVMVFVNEIAEIVHGVVDQFSGSANKNIGDAFLLVWKYAENDYYQDEDGKLSLKPYEHVAQIADMAILSFVTIITNVTLSQKLQKYKQHEGLNNRIPNYSVKMGFGLHVGWAIEGAIGSEYKIDASYLSPNVNMASRLEAATKQFGSMILISGQLRDVATKVTQKNLRHIDRVTVKGSIEPMDIYTVDLNVDSLLRKEHKAKTILDPHKKDKVKQVHLSESDQSKLKKKQKVLKRMKRDKLKQAVLKSHVLISETWTKDPNIKISRALFRKEFYSKWTEGFHCYLSGDWDKAKSIFEETLNFLPNYRDGPSNTLLRVIKEEPYLRNNWKGYRELTEK
ncbi:unnamed protein product (macronuclear) [Paramecium tetraurelia]|uniref:Guanylate cyclase domain-containing protein n=1 Tax=Paramecium tetraurelia TaxID=5888 RepID=A0EBY3_PARTE|nr:uncharacterized protein GSPATT00025536001 [Paramecium tetraurelia]CAK92800.1 unnamed protein product [Paramecium tetraurelia]|eukprot:XP_001460197.1 hypothetical protein (macronuclear) [Paramecium tetraurelia strain d4-2]